MAPTSVFKTAEDQATYFEAYDTTLKELWPVSYEEIDLPSRFGMTHVVACGPEDGPPLVLLHGFMVTLTMWAPNIADLSKYYRVYAIDTMGQPSKSVPDEPIQETADFVEWLDATLDGLNLHQIFLAGMSFGAWIALNFAIAEPERIRKLVLLSPAAAFQPLVKQFGVRAVLSGVIRTRRMMDSFMGWMGLKETPGDTVVPLVLDLMWLGGKYFQMPPETRRVKRDVFSDDELRGLKMSVLLLIGENEAIYDSTKAMARARQLIPDFEGELLPDCSHDMSMTQHQTVNPRILEFLLNS